MGILASVTQQPLEIRDYDINFVEWFPATDTITAVAISSAPVGLVVGYALLTPVVKVWVQSGVNGVTYKITVRASTYDGRAKEVEIKVKIKDT